MTGGSYTLMGDNQTQSLKYVAIGAHMENGTHNIDITQYFLYHAYDSVSPEFIQGTIREYEKILADNGNRVRVTFRVKTVDADRLGRWTLLFCSVGMDFYHFHNLLGWVGDNPDDAANRPKGYLGVAVHKGDSQRSFVVMPVDNNPEKDTMQGFFRSGTQFSVYLPEAFRPGGNMVLQGPAERADTMDLLLKWKGLSPDCFRPEYYRDAETVLEGMFSPD